MRFYDGRKGKSGPWENKLGRRDKKAARLRATSHEMLSVGRFCSKVTRNSRLAAHSYFHSKAYLWPFNQSQLLHGVFQSQPASHY